MPSGAVQVGTEFGLWFGGWDSICTEGALFGMFVQIPDAGGDFRQGYYAPLPQFIPPGFLPGIHYIPSPPFPLGVLPEASKDAAGKKVWDEWSHAGAMTDLGKMDDVFISLRCKPPTKVCTYGDFTLVGIYCVLLYNIVYVNVYTAVAPLLTMQKPIKVNRSIVSGGTVELDLYCVIKLSRWPLFACMLYQFHVAFIL